MASVYEEYLSVDIPIFAPTSTRNRYGGRRAVVQKESEATKVAALQKRIAELEQALGQKQMVIDYQAKLLETASQELGVDLKKNTKAKC
ncbi:MAG: hypothetical protein AAF944_12180 [Bacteroidota bacterium]